MANLYAMSTYHAMEEEKCQLINGVFPMLVQGTLGFLAASTLYIKWRLEYPKRPFRIWLFDLSKQLVAGSFAHGMNMLIAELLSHSGTATAKSDECAWYFLNYVFDAVFGVPLCWGLVRALEATASKFNWNTLKVSGDYGDPPLVVNWAIQLTSWTIILIVSKAILAMPLVALQSSITKFGEDLFHPLQPYPKFELIVVMVLAPCLLNALQFWIFDQVLKKGGGFSFVGHLVLARNFIVAVCTCNRRLFCSQGGDHVDETSLLNDPSTSARLYNLLPVTETTSSNTSVVANNIADEGLGI